MAPATKRLLHAYNQYLLMWFVERETIKGAEFITGKDWNSFYDKT